MTMDDLWGDTSFNKKFVSSKKVLKRITKNISQEKMILKILRWPYVTFNDLWGFTLFNENLRLHDVIILIKIGS